MMEEDAHASASTTTFVSSPPISLMQKYQTDYIHPGLELRRVSNKKGNGFVAIEKIPAGTLLMRARPFICLYYEEVDKLFAATFPEHLSQAKMQIVGSQMPYLCHALVVHRILKRIEESQQSDATSQQRWEVERVLNLYPSAEEAVALYEALGEKKQKSLDEVVRRINQIQATESQGKQFDVLLIRRLALMVLANPHDITMETGKTLGMGLYPAASLINHSCYPNCVSYFRKAEEDEQDLVLEGKNEERKQKEGTENEKENEKKEEREEVQQWHLCVRAVADIEIGEEACQSYIDLYATRETRQGQLQARYFFTCECERCTSESFQKRDSVLEALMCSDTKCNNGRLTKELLTAEEKQQAQQAQQAQPQLQQTQTQQPHQKGRVVWRCCVCERLVEDEEVRPRLDELEVLRREAEKMDRSAEVNEEAKLVNVKRCNQALLMKAKGFLHPFHVLYFKTNVSMIAIIQELISIGQLKIEALNKQKQQQQQQQENTTMKEEAKKEVTRLMNLVKELNIYASQTVKMVGFIIPKNMPEIAGLLRAEHKSLTLMAMLSTDVKERAALLQKVKVCVQRAEEINKITRGGSLLSKATTNTTKNSNNEEGKEGEAAALGDLKIKMKQALLEKLKEQVNEAKKAQQQQTKEGQSQQVHNKQKTTQTKQERTEECKNSVQQQGKKKDGKRSRRNK